MSGSEANMRQHILARPDTYVGSCVRTEAELLWIYNSNTEKFFQQKLNYIPALLKLFDDILVNAADNRWRAPPLTKVFVKIDRTPCQISVWNDGKTIPIVKEDKNQNYVPTIVFGGFATNIDVDRVFNKTEGYGAKMVNVLSQKFQVEIFDKSNSLKFFQQFSNNMSEKQSPQIERCSQFESSWTKITFVPDQNIFQLKEKQLDEDHFQLMKKRVFDIAGILGGHVEVFFNEEKIKVDSFQDYIKLYLSQEQVNSMVYEDTNPRCQICVVASTGHFKDVSFVNNFCTYKGGTHIDFVKQQISNIIQENLNLKFAEKIICSNIWIFINLFMDRPTFDSQDKQRLVSPINNLQNQLHFTDQFIDKLLNSTIFQEIKQKIDENKEEEDDDDINTNEKNQHVYFIDELIDAQQAGTKNQPSCTLLIGLGGSTRGMVQNGFFCLNKQTYGVYFCKYNKILNVRDASNWQISQNKQINDLMAVLGLLPEQKIQGQNRLRYNRVIIFSEKDEDGIYGKALLLNFFDYYLQTEIKNKELKVYEFLMPFVEVQNEAQRRVFYTEGVFQVWKEEIKEGILDWMIRYHTGLGFYSEAEMKQYFEELENHIREFIYESKESDIFSVVFSKQKIDLRREWSLKYMFEKQTFQSQMNHKSITFEQFFNTNVIQYYEASYEAAIPSMIDGFNLTQRKIFFTCLKQNILEEEITVEKLSNLVEIESGFQGELSLIKNTIIKMTQNFPGTNNINLLEPIGWYGSRFGAASDASDPRCISTRLVAAISRLIYRKDDDAILQYKSEQGQTIEPNYYLPIIPMVLVNGATGISIGYSTFVPQFRLQDIIENCKTALQNIINIDKRSEVPLLEMLPYYNHNTGQIYRQQEEPHKWVSEGVFRWLDDETIQITELPIGMSTQQFKNRLNQLKQSDQNQIIVNYYDNSTSNKVNYVVKINTLKKQSHVINQEKKVFALNATLRTCNMVLLNSNKKIQKFESAEEIIGGFIGFRLKQYEQRKEYLIESLRDQILRKQNQRRFIQEYFKNGLCLKAKSELQKYLEDSGFDKLPLILKSEGFYSNELDTNAQKSMIVKDFEYLFQIRIQGLSLENFQNMEIQIRSLQKDLDELKSTSAEILYMHDLDKLLQTWTKLEHCQESA